jgi:hypothetical protein
MGKVRENARRPADLDGNLAAGAAAVTAPERADLCGAWSVCGTAACG